MKLLKLLGTFLEVQQSDLEFGHNVSYYFSGIILD